MTAVIDVTDRPVFHLGAITFRTLYPSGVASTAAVGTAQADTVMLPAGVGSVVALGTAATVASVGVSGIAGAEATGVPSVTLSAHPDGVAGSGDLGSPASEADMQLSGLPSGAVLGSTTMFTSMNPAGVNAATGAVGTPATVGVLHPSGVGSAVAFGDADTLATVFIIPGPVDPSNDFGDAVVTKRGWVFRGPRIQLGWRFQKRWEGVSLLKEDGSWVEVSHPDMPRTLSAENYLPGGHEFVVSDSLKAELIAAGYSVTDEVVTTEDYKT